MTTQQTDTGNTGPVMVDRAEAVRVIAGHIADRDAFVISIPPAFVASAAARLHAVRACAWYTDNGTGVVMQLAGRGIQAAGVLDELLPGLTAAVAIVPKTVPAAELAAAMRHAIPGDGSQDLVLLHGGGEADAIVWPVLLVDALARIDPAFVACLVAEATS